MKPETKKLVNAERIAMMKSGAMLINTARGEIDRPGRPRRRPQGRQDSRRPRRLRSRTRRPHRRFRRCHHRSSQHARHTPRRASTEQAQEAIAEEAIRIIEAYVKTGVVLNCVNIAKRTPAKWQMVVRHFDRVGVLAFVMDQLRRAEINIEEVQNQILEGAQAACCRIQLSKDPGADLVKTVKEGNKDIISVETLQIA
jgi:D-3-phosphoglycerate dehydrogenase